MQKDLLSGQQQTTHFSDSQKNKNSDSQSLLNTL